MRAVVMAALGGMRRRRAQTLVIAVVLLLATGASTLALSILVESQAPFDHAFAEANGAHLVVDYETSLDTAAVAATATQPGVSGSAGPWSVGRADLADPRGGRIQGALMSDRADPDTTVDRMTLDAGRWWNAPGEAVLSRTTALLLGKGPGDTIDLSWSAASKDPGAPAPTGGNTRRLTVVGIGASISTPDVAVWMSPADLARLIPAPARTEEMLYRVDPAASSADLAAAQARITAMIPGDQVADSRTYLAQKAETDSIADLFVPILLSFSVFALLAAAFTIVNVVSGIVLSNVRGIGVLTSIGFTPIQVTATVAGQVGIPAVVGALGGVLLGTIVAQPVVDRTAASFGLPAAAAASASVAAPVLVVALVVTALTAILPAWAAGRMRPAVALGHGAPSRPGGRAIRRLGFVTRLPLPARLGLVGGLAHPVRATMTLGALVVGVAAATFAVGLDASLLRVSDALTRADASPVRVEIATPKQSVSAAPTGSPSSAAAETSVAVADAIANDPQTERWVGSATTEARADGGVPVSFVGYDGPSDWIGYRMIAGRWFDGPGEVVAPTTFLSTTGRRVGDSVTLTASGQTVTAVVVGEYFDANGRRDDPPVLRGTWSDAQHLAPGLVATAWETRPQVGTDPHTYRSSLQDAIGRGPAMVEEVEQKTTDVTFLLFLGVTALLGIVLVAVSLAGVFNTILLETRQKTRQIAIVKAIGMTPRDVATMVLATVVPVAVVAGLIGVPLGIAFQRAVLDYMGQIAAGTAIPESIAGVFGPLAVLGLVSSGLVIAIAGAAVPATRAATARIAPVLQAE